MTAPLKLAAEIERTGLAEIDPQGHTVHLASSEVALLAAALRLAEALNEGDWEVGDRWQPFRPGNQATLLLADYRKAREV